MILLTAIAGSREPENGGIRLQLSSVQHEIRVIDGIQPSAAAKTSIQSTSSREWKINNRVSLYAHDSWERMGEIGSDMIA